MKSGAPPCDVAEMLHLHREGLSVRRIARHLHRARKTVRRLLEEHGAPVKPMAPRRSFLAPYEESIRARLDDTSELRASVEST